MSDRRGKAEKILDTMGEAVHEAEAVGHLTPPELCDASDADEGLECCREAGHAGAHQSHICDGTCDTCLCVEWWDRATVGEASRIAEDVAQYYEGTGRDAALRIAARIRALSPSRPGGTP